MNGNHINRFVLKNTFIKVYIYFFLINIFFYKNKELKLDFGDHIIITLNDFVYGEGDGYGGRE